MEHQHGGGGGPHQRRTKGRTAAPPSRPGDRPKIAIMDAGIGLLAAASVVRRLRPDADLVLSSDPDGMPWGPRSARDITARALAVGEAAAARRPHALVVACNTATVHALPALRARFEPELPVIGTVPAIKPAAVDGGPLAVWATPATTGSAYQRSLIRRFAGGTAVTEVPCPGLSDAVEQGDEDAIGRAIAAARRTPAGVRSVVLGCTHYELVAERIRAALAHPGLPPLVLHGSAPAVAAQALRRTGHPPAPHSPADGTLTVLLSGREAALPGPALTYAEGRLLLRGPGRAPVRRRPLRPAAAAAGTESSG
ncbi:glutamate racemase [Streptomyces rimosus subsp. rimosus ATCC 10970]|uniref:Glutamate racemase n=3 Tax=Streptomyces TaxID=1883 RepID=A0A8A1UGT7_STRR1|nr:glutamate racemase [Streptomyces sp. SID5471]QDA08869.1 glutamate racemase [Streptomyces rimosus]QST79087.1 glutamate racemase [Streptomyces rimosus subsp. rimosus ATCC 10970]QTL91015.1 glutamate racemase [Streptomyces rimosus subsp. rimosus]QEV80148.1 glutamate racemase [Streptomyces rimosus]